MAKACFHTGKILAGFALIPLDLIIAQCNEADDHQEYPFKFFSKKKSGNFCAYSFSVSYLWKYLVWTYFDGLGSMWCGEAKIITRRKIVNVRMEKSM